MPTPPAQFETLPLNTRHKLPRLPSTHVSLAGHFRRFPLSRLPVFRDQTYCVHETPEAADDPQPPTPLMNHGRQCEHLPFPSLNNNRQGHRVQGFERF